MKKKNPIVEADFLTKEKEKLVRSQSKSIRFNSKELELIDKYCEQYKVKSKSALLRTIIMKTILQQFDEDYPRLF